jgi:hypothetical protein
MFRVDGCERVCSVDRGSTFLRKVSSARLYGVSAKTTVIYNIQGVAVIKVMY